MTKLTFNHEKDTISGAIGISFDEYKEILRNKLLHKDVLMDAVDRNISIEDFQEKYILPSITTAFVIRSVMNMSTSSDPKVSLTMLLCLIERSHSKIIEFFYNNGISAELSIVLDDFIRSIIINEDSKSVIKKIDLN